MIHLGLRTLIFFTFSVSFSETILKNDGVHIFLTFIEFLLLTTKIP